MKGFTLIETLIAVSILALAIAGPLVTANRAIVAAETARDQLTASYLAQEAIEYVRLMRDDEFLSTYQAGTANLSVAAWTRFVSGADSASSTSCIASTCLVDASPGVAMSAALTPCSGNSCTPLYVKNGAYTQSSSGGAVQTVFTRTLQATTISGNEERIVATVSWNFHGIPYIVTSTDHLTSWQ